MIYQRSSTTFELISLDEGGGSGSGGNMTIAEEVSDRQRKLSRKQKHRHSKTTISSSNNYTDAGSDFEDSPERRERRTGNNSLQQISRHKSGESDSSATLVRLSKKLNQSNNANDKFQLENNSQENNNQPESYLSRNSIVLLPFNQQSFHPYYTSNTDANILEPSASSNQRFDPFDPTTTTSISEMIADDCDNEDDDSFAIFQTNKNESYQNYYQNQNFYSNHYRSQHHNNKHFDPNRNYENLSIGENENDDEQNLLDQSQTFSRQNSVLSEDLNELEQYERDDHVGEMMPKDFGRKNRRVS